MGRKFSIQFSARQTSGDAMSVEIIYRLASDFPIAIKGEHRVTSFIYSSRFTAHELFNSKYLSFDFPLDKHENIFVATRKLNNQSHGKHMNSLKDSVQKSLSILPNIPFRLGSAHVKFNQFTHHIHCQERLLFLIDTVRAFFYSQLNASVIFISWSFNNG